VNLSRSQLAFLSLHVTRHVTEWRWYWFETMLRATANGNGGVGVAGKRTATIWRDEADALVQAGLMEWGVERAWLRVTANGAELVRQEETAHGEGR
jgi:hypothetical protein